MASLYDMSVPIYTQALKNTLAFLKKGEAWCKDNGHPVEKLLEGKLAEDMKPLPFQICTISNTAKLTCVRIAGTENDPWEDNETTFEQLYERITKTIKFLEKVKPEDFAGKEQSQVVMKTGVGDFKFTGLSYLQSFALPNFFFHEMAAYAILRNQGVPIGKFDYLGSAGQDAEKVQTS
ncbi:hypothetical protein BAUCODRAFT_34713 [Baudoinia panamericana UAMH 10762]|uniref:DUF1993 domain-containing protein n=1 Tax=Baudoinia panamericana (strain UAMH 10762) TaxID=717646 RepID=M2MH51_BAUPA|nr:uncharacterized protein BAUCODRAFT_34713 [Baudoinia panamericana UAMH 10762]EMC95946.1 hypothetical protein BAUCODRAFT_34713 [Baudoinia panamericana UAMH 10762]